MKLHVAATNGNAVIELNENQLSYFWSKKGNVQEEIASFMLKSAAYEWALVNGYILIGIVKED